MKTLFLQLLLFCPFVSLMAQDNVNMKFGKPTKEEMQMTTYAAGRDTLSGCFVCQQ